jgi:type IV fimbrial biogenesis protein FimT
MRKTKGFTLLELLITVLLMAIVAAVAAPSMREFVLRSRIRSVTGDLVSALALARSEAILRGTDVAVCAMDATTQAQCLAATPALAQCKVDDSSQFFEQGWLVLEGSCTKGSEIAEDKILRKFEPRPEVLFDAVPATGGLVFKANGVLSGTVGTTLGFNTGSASQLKRTIQISSLGRIKVVCTSGTPPACL